ncbi:MAG: hypothetical protein K2K20_07995 [Lachnospiraceae bacterium]|nr:hypothetical protein [Lachnospiraceae bacterium]
MKLKRVIALFAAAAVIAGSTISVSAAEPISGDYLTALIESGNAELILNVDAYRAAYSDLDAAFGDNTNAYIEHYLTMGIYEGRTSGALFDPLAYAEAYGDVKAAFGDNTEALIDHYINFGISENRTEGTAHGYADIAQAQMIAASTVASGGSNSTPAANTGQNIFSSIFGGNAGSSSYSGNTGNSSNNSGSALAGATAPAPAPTVNNTPVNNGNNYHHTTSIYESDGTLIRIEYYDENNRLFEYSDVINYDKTTNSYTENIFDVSNTSDTPDRTNNYEGGVLVPAD